MSLVLSSIAGFLFGFVPVLQLWSKGLSGALKENTKTSSSNKNHAQLRKSLIAIEIALAIVLLSGAGLMLKSFARMNENASGFKPESILTMRVTLAGGQYASWIPQQNYIETALAKLRAFPGVETAGIDSQTFNTKVEVEGLGSDGTFSAVRSLSLGYLRAMGVPLIAGRWPADNRQLDEALVNESFANPSH